MIAILLLIPYLVSTAVCGDIMQDLAADTKNRQVCVRAFNSRLGVAKNRTAFNPLGKWFGYARLPDEYPQRIVTLTKLLTAYKNNPSADLAAAIKQRTNEALALETSTIDSLISQARKAENAWDNLEKSAVYQLFVRAATDRIVGTNTSNPLTMDVMDEAGNYYGLTFKKTLGKKVHAFIQTLRHLKKNAQNLGGKQALMLAERYRKAVMMFNGSGVTVIIARRQLQTLTKAYAQYHAKMVKICRRRISATYALTMTDLCKPSSLTYQPEYRDGVHPEYIRFKALRALVSNTKYHQDLSLSTLVFNPVDSVRGEVDAKTHDATEVKKETVKSDKLIAAFKENLKYHVNKCVAMEKSCAKNMAFENFFRKEFETFWDLYFTTHALIDACLNTQPRYHEQKLTFLGDNFMTIGTPPYELNTFLPSTSANATVDTTVDTQATPVAKPKQPVKPPVVAPSAAASEKTTQSTTASPEVSTAPASPVANTSKAPIKQESTAESVVVAPDADTASTSANATVDTTGDTLADKQGSPTSAPHTTTPTNASTRANMSSAATDRTALSLVTNITQSFFNPTEADRSS